MPAPATLVSERLCGELQQAITTLSWSRDGEFLAIASAGGELLFLDSGPALRSCSKEIAMSASIPLASVPMDSS